MAGPAVLVVGGAGYIGSHVCLALAEAGFLPVTYDDLSRGHEEAVQWGPLERGDLRDAGRLSDALARHRPVAAIHLAGLIEVGESVRDPGLFWDVNVGGSLTLLDQLAAHGVGRVIFSSTAAVYGMPETELIGEATPCRPTNPYGRSKWVVEQALADYQAAHGLTHVALRYFNAAGADSQGRLGEAHRPESHLIPRILMALTGELDGPLTLFGTDYPTPDGTAVRDYVHVSDLAAAHVKALGHLLAGGGSLAVNVGTGRGLSVRQVLAAAEEVTGLSVPVRVAPRRPGDPPRLVADPTLGRRLLGLETRFDAPRSIIATAWNWHRGGRRQWLGD